MTFVEPRPIPPNGKPGALAIRKLKPEPSPPISEISVLIQMIERAARDPSVDVDKMQRLLDMRERAMAMNAKGAYTAALSAMQPELPIIDERGKIEIGKNSKPQTYARWDDINEVIKPVLARHGFALSFRPGSKDGKIVVTGILSHRDGHSEEATMELPFDTTGSKNAVQAVGSSLSYGQRYTAKALLNLTSRAPIDKDDDGNAAAGNGPISDAQKEQLSRLLMDTNSNIAAFCAYIKTDRIDNIRAKDFPRALAALEVKRASINRLREKGAAT